MAFEFREETRRKLLPCLRQKSSIFPPYLRENDTDLKSELAPDLEFAVHSYLGGMGESNLLHKTFKAINILRTNGLAVKKAKLEPKVVFERRLATVFWLGEYLLKSKFRV